MSRSSFDANDKSEAIPLDASKDTTENCPITIVSTPDVDQEQNQPEETAKRDSINSSGSDADAETSSRTSSSHSDAEINGNETSEVHQNQLNKKKDRVVINVGGVRHETYKTTLKNIPDTRLSWLAESSASHTSDYDPEKGEFFFDRHPAVFAHILNYYRTGQLHSPYDVCGPLFEEELSYWGIDDTQVESCCWINYRQHRDAQETLKDFEAFEFEGEEDDSEPDMARYGFSVGFVDDKENTTWWERNQPKIWTTMEDPYSSKLAKTIAWISLTLILLSVMLFCLETLKTFKEGKENKQILVILEGICVIWFTVELSIRFTFCPGKLQFLKNILNWIDLLAIVPYFVNLVIQYGFQREDTVEFLQIIRVIRVFRIIKLSKHSMGLQILGHTLKASFHELFLLVFFLMIGIVIFSSLVYYCEQGVENTYFDSIPRTFWWAVITMTTVGYGDMVPKSIQGQIIGSLCAISGVLMIALPVPVIVNNFNLYYSHAQARSKLPKKKRKVLCGAANALKGPAMEALELESKTNELLNGLESRRTSRVPDGKCTVTITNEVGSESPPDEDNLAELRMKRFARRESHMFGSTQRKDSEPVANGNRLSLGGGGGGQTYALKKRQSLMPGIPALPEIEQSHTTDREDENSVNSVNSPEPNVT